MIQRTHRRLLFVEGKSELRLLPELLEANGISWPKGQEPVFIKAMGGFENFWKDRVIHTEMKAAALDAVGLIFDADEPEDHRWETVARYCRSWSYADEVVAGALARGARFDAKRRRDKAKIYSWLAWQEEPGKQLHEAVKHRVLEPTSPQAAPFVDWFRLLFP
jgi:hypothetical protein